MGVRENWYKPLIKSYIWGNQQHNGQNGSPNPLNMALSEVYFAIIKELRTKRAEIFCSGMGGQPLQRVYSPPPYWATLQVCAKIKMNTFIWDSSVVLLSPTCLNIFLDLLFEGMAGAVIEKCSV